MLLGAHNMLSKKALPTFVTKTEAEARAWLDRQRKKLAEPFGKPPV